MRTTLYNTRKLNKLSFIEFLKYMEERCSEISHVKKSDTAYFNAKELIRNIIRRYMKEYRTLTINHIHYEESNILFKDEHILDKYRASQGDKRKKAIIEEFKIVLSVDLFNMIHSKEVFSGNQYSGLNILEVSK